MNAELAIECAEKIASTFTDGFQLEDIATVIRHATMLAELQEVTGPEKKDLAVALVGHVIDITDTPWLPDALTDPLVKKLVPALIEMIVSVSNDGIKGTAT